MLIFVKITVCEKVHWKHQAQVSSTLQISWWVIKMCSTGCGEPWDSLKTPALIKTIHLFLKQKMQSMKFVSRCSLDVWYESKAFENVEKKHTKPSDEVLLAAAHTHSLSVDYQQSAWYWIILLCHYFLCLDFSFVFFFEYLSECEMGKGEVWCGGAEHRGAAHGVQSPAFRSNRSSAGETESHGERRNTEGTGWDL